MIDVIVILGGIVLLDWTFLRTTGISSIVRAHSPESTSESSRVGFFVVHRKGVLRRIFSGGIVRISASVDGLHISGVLPLHWKSAFIPWDQIRVQEDPESTTFGFGFSNCPELEWSMTKMFVAKLQHSIRTTVLRETPFEPLLT
jgi:hypothetical protein